ncbi:hypothetical protein ACH5RR_020505 [Cinchona calisaya]|uniref:Uncharacterized protein n=1 Tax=Cinchona calisaya TaxID=153742 RepID=A0ABD2ZGF7_9GENT
MTTMAATAGGSIGVSSFLSSSKFSQKAKPISTLSLSMVVTFKSLIRRQKVAFFAVQESSAAAAAVAAETKEEEEKQEEKKETSTAEAAPAATTKKPPAKAPPKPLPQLMEEEVIPSLTATLEAQEDIIELEISFLDNRLEGSFLKKGFPYSFWAFFPDGNLTGPRGFCLSSYGSGVSTVEPFLVDEKRITSQHVVFWVEKRLAAQGIIPVWKE